MSDQTTISGPVFPKVKMNLITPKTPAIGRVVSNDLCVKGKAKSASFVRHTEIDVTGTPLAGNFVVGQSFGVIAPGVDENGKPHKVRLYSIACPTWGEDGQGNVVSTTPKRLIEEFKPQKPGDDAEDHSLFIGVCSNYLCDLRPGDEVKLTGPNGKRFLLPVDCAEHDFLFIATGTGIAPFRGMLLELLEGPNGPCQSQLHLVMGSPYTTDLMYDDLFCRLDEEHENFHYHVAISREPRPGSTRGIYVDRLIDDKIDVFGPLLAGPRGLVYLCGLLGMDAGVYRALVRHGLADAYIKVADEIAQIDPREWTSQQIKRHIRPTPRCMVEVY
ncbi:MAG: ferredoxin reductase domain-containing protein [Planctomycetota bacterium]|jgi:ferredoxin--NADP+ reductase